MSRYSASCLTTAGSTTLPISSLYGGTAGRLKLRQLDIFNTTATAVSLKLVRVTAAGTPGTGLTEMPWDQADVAATATAFNTHSVTPTITAGDLFRWVLPAAIGGGIIETFPEPGFIVPATANNGLAILVSAGTGQACEVTWTWEEA